MGNFIIPNNFIQRGDNKLVEEAEHPVNFADLRVYDAMGSNLPSTSSGDDLALVGGTFGSASPVLQTADAKNTTASYYARFLYTLPPEYVAGETVKLRVRCSAKTTVASSAMTIDVQAYEANGSGGIGSDLCTTAAQTCNSLTAANKDFSLTSTGLQAGDVLDVRLVIAITDSATATAVIGQIGKVSFLLDTRG